MKKSIYNFTKSDERINGETDMYRYHAGTEETAGYMKCNNCETDVVFDYRGFADIIDRAVKDEPIFCPKCQDSDFIMDVTLDNLAKVIRYREDMIKSGGRREEIDMGMITTDNIKIDLHFIKSYVINEFYLNNKELMISIIASILRDIIKIPNDVTIVNISSYKGTTEEKQKAIKDVCEKYKEGEHIICTTAYVSTDEFPEDKYFDIDFDEPVNGKQPVPYEEIIQRESIMLEELGFVNINNFIGYSKKAAYIYPNALGKQIIEYCDSQIRIDFQKAATVQPINKKVKTNKPKKIVSSACGSIYLHN